MHSPPRSSRSLLAPAKLNIGLEILRRRPDGYHELNTLFYRLEALADELVVRDSDHFELSGTAPGLDLGEDNLVARAARAFGKALGTGDPKLHFDLLKRIPTGAGLGGGSSDAATTLLVCNERQGSPLTTTQLCDLGRTLGADVPFFVQGAPAAMGRGIGDELTPVQLALPYYILLVKPQDVFVSTKDAYARVKLRPRETPTDLLAAIERREWNLIVNDFEEAIFPVAPELGLIKQELYREGALYASMSGSGATMFGLFEEESMAMAARTRYARDHFTFLATPRIEPGSSRPF